MMTPSTSFDFTSGSIDPRITFARALSTATEVNSSGLVVVASADAPRLDYDPVTLACKGLLIEESRTNSALYSQQFDNAYWPKVSASISANTAVSPDGTQNADKLVEDTTNNYHYIRSSVFTANPGQTFTQSWFVKAAGRSTGYIQFISGGSFPTNSLQFNLSTETVTVSGGTGFIQNYGNGWYRIGITVTATGTSSQNRIQLVLQLVNYLGDGVSGMNLWGAQLELGIGSTSYIPTTTAAVTRNADVATITGTNFSDWWQASKGGVLVRARPGTVSGTRPWVQFDDGTANEIIALRGNTTNPELYIVDGGTPQAQIDAGTIAANTDYSLTGWWATNDCKARLDNGAVVTDTSATIPTVTQARLGSDGTNYLNGHLASISYYDTFSGQIYTRRKNKAVFSLL